MKPFTHSISRVDLALLIGLFGASCFVATPQLVDITLSSRYLAVLMIVLVGLAINYNRIWYFFTEKISQLDILLLAFCLWQVVSCTWAINTAEAFGASFRSVTMFLSFVLIRAIMVSDQRWKGIIPKMVSLASCGYLILLWVNLIDISTDLGLNSQSVYLLRYPSETKNLISLFVLISIPFHVHVLLESKGWRRWLILSIIFVSFGTLFLLSTRGISISIVGVGCVLLMLQLVWKKYRFRNGSYLALGLILLGSGHWFGANLLKKKAIESYRVEVGTPIEDSEKPSAEQNYRSANERLALWRKTLGLIQQDPLLGVGAGNWQIAYPRNGLDGLERAEYRVTSFKRPHNIILSITSETGMIGLILFVLILFKFFNYIHRQGVEALNFGLAMIGFLIAAMFDFPLERMEHNLIFGTMLALSVGKEKIFKVSDKHAKVLMLGFFVLLAGGLVVFGSRFYGEIKYQQMRVLKSQNQFQECIDLCHQLESPFYTVDWINYPFAWYRGMCYTYLGEYDAGEKEFEQAIKMNPGNFHSLNNMGFCLAQQGQFDEATVFFERSLRINSKFEDARFNLAYSLIMLGKPIEALDVLSVHVRNTDKLEIYRQEAQKLLSK